jgi:hypothetical protein
MSDVVGAGTVAFSRGEDRPRGVTVAAGGVSAGRALEDADTQSEAVIGSLAAPGTGHRGAGGRHQHHHAARPPATLDKFSPARADRRAGGLAGHPALGEELRLEVLDRDQRVMFNDVLGPDTGVVCVLPGRPLRDPGRLPLGEQCGLRGAAGPQAVGVPHCLEHANNCARDNLSPASPRVPIGQQPCPKHVHLRAAQIWRS